jgi:hypothetical protein
VLVDAVPYTGQTTEHRRIVVEVHAHAVVGVRVGITRYPCADFGDVGPLTIREAGRAVIGRDGRFRFSAGEPAQRITIVGVLRRRTHRLTGTVRVRGTIATGQRCASGALRFVTER